MSADFPTPCLGVPPKKSQRQAPPPCPARHSEVPSPRCTTASPFIHTRPRRRLQPTRSGGTATSRIAWRCGTCASVPIDCRRYLITGFRPGCRCVLLDHPTNGPEPRRSRADIVSRVKACGPEILGRADRCLAALHKPAAARCGDWQASECRSVSVKQGAGTHEKCRFISTQEDRFCVELLFRFFRSGWERHSCPAPSPRSAAPSSPKSSS
jgi:hypothetical protein